jgi:peroxiredoxin
MQVFSWMSRASILAVAAWAIGCAQQPAQPQAEKSDASAAPEQQASAAPQERPSSAGEEQAAAAKASAIADDQVQPATAVTPVPAVDAPAQPVAANAGASLPLEEAIDSGQSMPSPHFTEQHVNTCKVLVGDQFPKLELADVSGQSQNFGELLGEKLTVVVFWNSQLPTSLEELADLEKRYLGEFGERGMKVVGVNVHDKPELAKELAEQSGAKFPELSDAAGQAFASVASAKLPRTYLLDASGKILWFDIEYSRTTRQQLLSAIRHSLAQK